MTKINLSEAKAHFSSIIDKVASGDEIIITRHGHPLAKIIPIQSSPAKDIKTVFENIASIRRSTKTDGSTINELKNIGRR